MIENLLDQTVFKNGHEVSFILGHKVLSKSGQDWNEVNGDPLTVSEWEDLKDLCLIGNEKVQLETKGFVGGLYESQKHSWKFTFIERKDSFRAHLSLVKAQEETLSQIENPLFWETVKIVNGLRLRANAGGGCCGVPMRRHHEDRARAWQFHAQRAEKLRGVALGQRHHRRAVREK